MKTKMLRDRRTAEITAVVLNVAFASVFGVQLWSGRPHSRLDPAVRQARAWHKVGVARTRPDRPCLFTWGVAFDSQPVVMWRGSNVAYILLGVIS